MTDVNPLLRPVLEHQASVLAPIRTHLQAAVVHPPIAPHEWQGPAARAFASIEDQLRDRVRAAEDAVSAALHHTRIAAGRLDG